MCLQVSASLRPDHKVVWSLLLALQTTGKRKDMLSNFELQLLIREPNYEDLEQLSEHVDMQDDSTHARAQRQEAIEFGRVAERLMQNSWMTPGLIQGGRVDCLFVKSS